MAGCGRQPEENKTSYSKSAFQSILPHSIFFSPASYCLELRFFRKDFFTAAPIGERQLWLPTAGTIQLRRLSAENDAAASLLL
jgi:hypothetical protein